MSRRTPAKTASDRARKCVDCSAGLQDEDGTRCVECAARALTHQRRYDRSAKGRATTRARMSRLYHARRTRGECVGGCGRAALPGIARCQEHADRQKLARVGYAERKEPSP
jgi:DNA-directed RNA polymerase subunit RPC12/RpoP